MEHSYVIRIIRLDRCTSFVLVFCVSDYTMYMDFKIKLSLYAYNYTLGNIEIMWAYFGMYQTIIYMKHAIVCVRHLLWIGSIIALAFKSQSDIDAPYTVVAQCLALLSGLKLSILGIFGKGSKWAYKNKTSTIRLKILMRLFVCRLGYC